MALLMIAPIASAEVICMMKARHLRHKLFSAASPSPGGITMGEFYLHY
ncbi:MAG: hypothetical protein R2727_03070 [Bacteroidales bacterium]